MHDSGICGSGAVYTRWGRTICPPTSAIIYKGSVGGAKFSQPGGGANPLCMPETPQYFKHTDTGTSMSVIMGAEYQIYGEGQRELFNNKLSAISDNMPCVVCELEKRLSILMIPARTTCPDNWTIEYVGYLMAENTEHRNFTGGRSMYTCVDKDSESVPGMESNVNGLLFYFTSADAHTFLGYKYQKELSCVICSK